MAPRIICYLPIVALSSAASPGLADSSAAAAPLFDGATLSGWRVESQEPAADGDWTAADGVIVADNPERFGSVLWTETDFTDFELTLEYCPESAYYDSGVFVRSGLHQVQIGISGSLRRDMTAEIYAPKDGRGPYPTQTDREDDPPRLGQWHQLRIVVRGKQIETHLNGAPIVSYETATMPASGPIGLQLHAGHHMRVLFRDIHLRQLDETD